MTDAELDELERLASKATPGPWRVGVPLFRCQNPAHKPARHVTAECVHRFLEWWDGGGEVISRDIGYTETSTKKDEPPVIAGMWDYELGGIQEPADAAFIAAANPDTVRALVAEVKRLRAMQPDSPAE